MKSLQKIIYSLSLLVFAGAFITGCQKLDRPEMKEIIPDPPPPPTLGASSLFPFDRTPADVGSFKLSMDAKSVTYIDDGVSAEAAQIGKDGYLVARSAPDSLKNPGSVSVAFWMKGAPGPVAGGAQGLFSFANSTQFWGNFEVYLENYEDATDKNAAFFKVHLLNSNIAGGGEQWVAPDAFKVPNVLGKWTHIAISYDAGTSTLTMYKDGASVGSQVLAAGAYGPLKFADFSGVTIGNFAFQTTPSLTNHGPESWATSFNGALDQFRIYTKALTAADVTNLYDNKY